MQTLTTVEEYQQFNFCHGQVFVVDEHRFFVDATQGAPEIQGHGIPLQAGKLDALRFALNNQQVISVVSPLLVHPTPNKHNNWVITFYHEGEENGFLSNLYLAPVYLDGKVWPSVEHYYQAMKHDEPAIIEAIRQEPLAIKAKQLARAEAKRLNRRYSREKKIAVMQKGLLAKFQQHPYLRKLLLETHPFMLVEKAPCDAFWGDGPDGHGENMMGLLCMHVRADLFNG